MADRIYLDHAATAPLLADARRAMADELAIWANPSSPHAEGRAARARVEKAREAIRQALGWGHDILFTSGSSEAIEIALKRSVADAVLPSAVEHDSVLRMTRGSDPLPVDGNGMLSLDAMEAALADRANAMVAVQHVNSETSVIQPVEAIAEICKARGALFFCDAAQSAAKIALPPADMIAIAAHKFGGPPGIGALLVRDLAMLEPSGGQEKGYRGGTENLPAIAGFAAAAGADRGWIDKASRLRDRLDAGARSLGIDVVAEPASRLPTIGAYRLSGMAASAQLIRFDMAGMAISAGSACSSGTLKTSHVLTAMGYDDKAAGEVVRISIGRDTDEAAIERVLALWAEIRA